MGVAAHILTLAAGFYAGIYFDQNYELPKVPSPQEIQAKLESYLASKRKES